MKTPELPLNLLQVSKDLLGALNSSMAKMQSDIDAASFVVNGLLSLCCINLCTCCTSLANAIILICAAISTMHPAPGAQALATQVLALTALTTASSTTALTESTAFTAALPTLGSLVLQLPGQIDNAITGALKAMYSTLQQLQFPEAPEELENPPQEGKTA